jgi:hypothetical protein
MQPVNRALRNETQGESGRTLAAFARTVQVSICALPILTSVVVRGTTRKLSDQAIAHIYNECKELGIDVGLDPKGFVDEQAKLTRAVVASRLLNAD